MDAVVAKAAEPSRVCVARLVRGLSRTTLGAYVGCSPSLIARFELGQRNATDYVHKLASVLNFPHSFFYGERIDVVSNTSFSYRRKCSMKASARSQMEATASIFASDLTRLISCHVHLPEVTVPDLSGLLNESPIQTGESISAALRQRFEMGDSPLRSSVDLAESMGVLVFWISGPDEFDAVSFWLNGRPFIVANRNITDGFRFRFSVLHEILHIVAHRRIDARTKSHDRQADAFASAMLMPVATFVRFAPRRFEPFLFLEMRHAWGASVAAMVRRCNDLGLISERAYTNAMIRMQELGWRKKEPKPIAVEESSVQRYFFEEAADAGSFAMELSDRISMPYDLFLEAFPKAFMYERAANKLSDMTTC